jgi:hypothetical protein
MASEFPDIPHNMRRVHWRFEPWLTPRRRGSWPAPGPLGNPKFASPGVLLVPRKRGRWGDRAIKIALPFVSAGGLPNRS